MTMVARLSELTEPRRAPTRPLRVVGLFAGVGGLELGLRRAGHDTELLCELMPNARACLETHFEGVDLHADVTDSELPSHLPERFDLLTAGFPCQDLSQAGRGRGIHGDHSGLILRVFDILRRRPKQARPRWLLLENVAFMRLLSGGRAMKVVLDELTDLGYAWAYRQVDSRAFGLPQRRHRIYFVACKRGEGDPREVLLADTATRPKTPAGPAWLTEGKACGFYWTEGNRGLGWAYDSLPAIKGGSTVQIPSPPAIVHPEDGVLMPSIEDAEALQGFPRGWTEPAIGMGKDKNGRSRWYLVGNAVSVPVARWLGHRLAEPGEYPADRESGCKEVPEGSSWPKTAWRMSPDEPIRSGSEGDWPIDGDELKGFGLERKGLRDVLDEGDETRRRPLSERAMKGFLSRFKRSSLLRSSDPDLRQALIAELEKHLTGH